LTVRNVKFQPLPGKPFDAITMRYSFDGSPTTLSPSPVVSNTVVVTNYNQTPGDNFQLYFLEQAPDFPLPNLPLGCPEAGLTNQQCWDKYGLAMAGAVAPCSTTRPEITGFACATGTQSPPPPPPPPPGTTPLPTLDLSGLPKELPVNGNLSFNYPVSGVTFGWDFQPVNGNGSVGRTAVRPYTSNVSAPAATTSVPRFSLASLNLIAGVYKVAVTVTQGSQSQSGTATITLVSADLSHVRVYPNPWRKDK